LVPLDVGESALDALVFVNGLAAQRRMTIVLLHVIKLNILAPESRVYLELEGEAITVPSGDSESLLAGLALGGNQNPLWLCSEGDFSGSPRARS